MIALVCGISAKDHILRIRNFLVQGNSSDFSSVCFALFNDLVIQCNTLKRHAWLTFKKIWIMQRIIISTVVKSGALFSSIYTLIQSVQRMDREHVGARSLGNGLLSSSPWKRQSLEACKITFIGKFWDILPKVESETSFRTRGSESVQQ